LTKIDALKQKINLKVTRQIGLLEQRSILQRHLTAADELLNSISTINGSFADPISALLFSRPLINRNKFMHPFIKTYTEKDDSDESEEFSY
jgi:hypothetical protein